MIKLDKQFGTFYDIFKKAVEISYQLYDDVQFEFNGVTFQVYLDSELPSPKEVEDYIKYSQYAEVML